MPRSILLQLLGSQPLEIQNSRNPSLFLERISLMNSPNIKLIVVNEYHKNRCCQGGLWGGWNLAWGFDIPQIFLLKLHPKQPIIIPETDTKVVLIKSGDKSWGHAFTGVASVV